MTSRRKDSIKNGEKGRKSLPLRQILWGVLTVFSLFVMLVAIRSEEHTSELQSQR